MTYTKLLNEFPEINPANYGDDEVNALNAWGIAAHIAIEALQSKLGDAIQSSAHWQHQFTELQAENERLSAGWQKANQEALRAKLTVQEQAKDIVLLCDDLKYIAGIARRAGMPVDDDNLKVRATILGAVQILEAERDALQAKLDAMGKGEPVTDSYVQPVPDKCDRIVWKGRYYHLPIAAPKALAPLTQQQRMAVWNDVKSEGDGKWEFSFGDVVDAVEKHHGIGGTHER